jgi:hypothetical protein
MTGLPLGKLVAGINMSVTLSKPMTGQELAHENVCGQTILHVGVPTGPSLQPLRMGTRTSVAKVYKKKNIQNIM